MVSKMYSFKVRKAYENGRFTNS
uniref:Uncharacterized protein n=1 Tax=Rhizophora mucronata TaxID=61149 RepID=A0A2P2Q8U4_RHIMU